ncbi:MAG: DUF4147 domain-containing protein [Pseudomonadota bacterium]|jgi:Putative glycerate kinase|nr:MAG: hydroxypyruvate reductase [Pseudomonadota bacterium]
MPDTPHGDPRRRLLLELLQAALDRVDGRRCTREALTARPPDSSRVWVAAVGKAAAAMALGAADALGAALERVLVITKDGHAVPDTYRLPGAEVLETAHPVPDARSLAAGERLLAWVDEMPPDVAPVFLVSGGASSLVEALADGVTLDELTRLNAEGLSSGISIGELNARRARLSRIKGGRLAARVAGRRARVLFISDVPGDDTAVIGSGLLGPVHADEAGTSSVPDDLLREVIASIDDAVEAACAAAREHGLTVHREIERFAGDAERLAVRFTHELRMGTEAVRVWGGESVVRLPDSPGRGGRNQHLALAAARAIAGQDDLLLLAAGTDGTDGPTEDAGGLVDGETTARVALAGLDVEECLRRADAGTALAAAEDLVHTGPTGTNVGDIVIGLKLSQRESGVLSSRHGESGPQVL